MNNFFISISNGLLTETHRDKIGVAVWEFMWLIDKVTRIDEDGKGWVLNGRPIKIKEICLGLSHSAVADNLKRLEDMKYIGLRRTPYGHVIWVNKAQKRFGKNTESPKKRLGENTESVSVKTPSLTPENAESNKTIPLDNTLDTVGDANVFSFLEELKKLKESKRKDLNIIALYWKKKDWKFENKKQFQSALKREMKPASMLTGYSGEQVLRSIEYCIKNYPEWTLETVHKRITDVVNKK